MNLLILETSERLNMYPQFNKLPIWEILEQASQLETRQAKIDFLRNNYSSALTTILVGVFHPRLQWLLPEGNFIYTPTKGEGYKAGLYSQIRLLGNLVSDGSGNNVGDRLRENKRISMFRDILESIDYRDAELLVKVKDKIMPYKGITYNLISEAFPNILPPQPKKETLHLPKKSKEEIKKALDDIDF